MIIWVCTRCKQQTPPKATRYIASRLPVPRFCDNARTSFLLSKSKGHPTLFWSCWSSFCCECRRYKHGYVSERNMDRRKVGKCQKNRDPSFRNQNGVRCCSLLIGLRGWTLQNIISTSGLVDPPVTGLDTGELQIACLSFQRVREHLKTLIISYWTDATTNTLLSAWCDTR